MSIPTTTTTASACTCGACSLMALAPAAYDCLGWLETDIRAVLGDIERLGADDAAEYLHAEYIMQVRDGEWDVDDLAAADGEIGDLADMRAAVEHVVTIRSYK